MKKTIFTIALFSFIITFQIYTPLYSQVNQAWAERYYGIGNLNDKAVSVVLDAEGNVYVAGKSTGSATGTDFATIKYNSAGVELWRARYNGPGNSVDEAKSIAIDSTGNIYVTGNSTGSGTGPDYATVKYNPDGTQLWVSRYNGPLNAEDDAASIAADESGNIYVTGSSFGTGTDLDYATIKYNTAGVQQWVARFNGPGNISDYAAAVTLDNAGNVFVTGNSYSESTDFNFATVKYNSAGIQQWAAVYNGPGNYTDNAASIATDGSGNVYVTGSIAVSMSASDMATIKYNSTGIQQWISRLSNGYGISLTADHSGNIYVTGYIFDNLTGYDYATVKYNSSGSQQWLSKYNGPGNSSDVVSSIAVDGSGNVYVTGYSYSFLNGSDYATIKYNSTGAQQWATVYSGQGNSSDIAYAVAADGSGNVYVTGSSSGYFATMKYNSSGTQQWVTKYIGPINSDDRATSVDVDGSGNVYVTGSSAGSELSATSDYVTIKYNQSGAEQWVARYNGPGYSTDNAYSIAVDGSGNVYVTGGSSDYVSGLDYATIKYNAEGERQWVARYSRWENSDDAASSLALDGSGNVYVTGYSTLSSNSDYTTIKYNSAGIQQWAVIYNGPGFSDDKANKITVDGSGNVYVTGYSTGSGTSTDFTTIKYNSSGIQQWVSRYNGPGNSTDKAYSIALDDLANVYVTGESAGSGTSSDFAVIKYNSAGVQLWVARYNGPGNSIDAGNSLNTDSLRNVYVTGYSTGSGTSLDYTTIKYDTAGAEQWIARYNGPGNAVDNAASIAVRGSGNVYVTGNSRGAGTGTYDYATIKYNSQGAEEWVLRYNGPGNAADYAAAIAVDGSDNVYVTGYSTGIGTNYDYATVKYSPPVGISQVTIAVPEQFSLSQNYPNPFNPVTNLEFGISDLGFVSLKVYDILGKEVVTLVNEKLSPGNYKVEFDGSGLTSGVYFYRLVVSLSNPLTAGEFMETKRMMIVK